MEANKGRVDTIRLQNLSYGHKSAAVFMAAVELDLFSKISGGASTIPAIAEALGITFLNAHRLVEACAGLELLNKDGENFTNAPDVEKFLVKGQRNYAGPWMLLQRRDFAEWNNMADLLRSKKPPTILGGYESYTLEKARQLHNATYSVGLGAGMRFARDVDMSKKTRILDLGGGSGAYCIAALQKYPHLKATVFDLPPVCVVAGEFIAEWDLSDQISTHPGDFTKDPFPGGADVMIQASNLPQYSSERLTDVFRKGFEALEPGGEYHLVGETINHDSGGPLGPSLWGIAEVLAGSEGRAHSDEEVKSYLEAAGFTDVTINQFIPGALCRITGQKPL